MFESHVFDRLNVRAWWRYEDDILVVSMGELAVKTLVDEMTSGSKPWVLKVEDKNMRSVHYLDVRVKVGSTYFQVHTEYMDSALRNYLSNESVHHRKIHVSWPLMMMRRVKSRCLHVDASERLHMLAQTILSAGVSEAIIQEAMRRAKGARSSSSLQGGSEQRGTFRLVIPYRPSWWKLLEGL